MPTMKRLMDKTQNTSSGLKSRSTPQTSQDCRKSRSQSSDENGQPPAKQRKLSPSKSVVKKKQSAHDKSAVSSKECRNGRGRPKKSLATPDGKKKVKVENDIKKSICKGKVGRPSRNTTKKSAKSTNKNGKQLIDLWNYTSVGKREASLNASLKVNILYEKQSSPKKLTTTDSSNSPDKTVKCSISTNAQSPKSKIEIKPKESIDGVKKKKQLEKSEDNKKKVDSANEKKSSKNKPTKNDSSSVQKGVRGRKRKCSPYTIFEDKDEPISKAKKKDKKKTTSLNQKKTPKKRRQSNILRHHLGNIIERSPRQASLNAKAMIAMEQEEEIIVLECSVRTRVYDWHEVRPTFQNECRKIQWMTGHGDPKYTSKLTGKRRASQSINKKDNFYDLVSNTLGDNNMCQTVKENVDNNSIHSTILKTIHEKGDPRLLREYLRSQKEDFQGEVDIERCPTPPPPPPQISQQSSATSKRKMEKTNSPKNKDTIPTKSTSPSRNVVKSPIKSPVKTTEKSPNKPNVKESDSSLKKQMPCRVATPIPQCPMDQRPTHMTSFIHHPVPQNLYSNVQQQPSQQKRTSPQQPQPIKVTPFSPNPAYIYQYPTDHAHQNVFVPGSASSMQYRVENTDLSSQDMQSSSFSFNQMGGLSFGRRGLNPYHPAASYNPIHLPVQAFGEFFMCLQDSFV